MKELGETLPYINRIEKPSFEVHPDLFKPYKLKKLSKMENYGHGETPRPKNILLWKGDQIDEKFEEVYDKLEPGGTVFFFNADHQKILQWRLDNKHSPQIHTLADNIWFWIKPVPFEEEDWVMTAADTVNEMKKTYETIQAPTPGEGHLTSELLKKYAYGKVFVETGTYFGQGVEAAIASKMFTEIYSIELDKDLADRADDLFGRSAKILWGDSPEMIESIALGYPADTPPVIATFWLDAHASGPLPGGAYGACPLIDELMMIRDYWDKNSTIMIDDCRLFGTPEWGGVTKNQALAVINEINPDYTIKYVDGEIPNDVLVAYVEK